MQKKDGFGHEKPNEGETNDWITPKWLIDAFDAQAGDKGMFFDLDPCASLTQPWNIARESYTTEQNGLNKNWYGTVWCNPPYGDNISAWAKRMAIHGDGIMLIFARVETGAWFNEIWGTADGFLIPEGRIAFYEFVCECGHPRSLHINSKKQSPCNNFRNTGKAIRGHEAGAPSILIAWGDIARKSLMDMCAADVKDDKGKSRRFVFLPKAFGLNTRKDGT